ncbi:hypothetical protein MTO96_031111 [Rhipicephalus appendiculatus]
MLKQNDCVCPVPTLEEILAVRFAKLSSPENLCSQKDEREASIADIVAIRRYVYDPQAAFGVPRGAYNSAQVASKRNTVSAKLYGEAKLQEPLFTQHAFCYSPAAAINRPGIIASAV